MNNGVINSAEEIIDSKYHNMDVYLPVVDEIKFRQATQIECFLKFTIDKTEKINGKHFLVGYAWNVSDCPGDFANNSVSEDYSTLMLKPAQLVL